MTYVYIALGVIALPVTVIAVLWGLALTGIIKQPDYPE